MSSIPWLAAAAAVGLAVVQLVRLARADADLSLLAKGRAPRGAFQGKVRRGGIGAMAIASGAFLGLD